LSVALNAALLIEKISNQAHNLERQVVERTKDLSVINDKLHLEINEKRRVEDQLKKAMESLESYNRELHNRSLRDELTGLYNRRGFMTLGLQQFEYSKLNKRRFIILYADMDGLKIINDKYGHNEGDFAIMKTAEILNRSFRSMDIVARLAGDEFTVLVVDAGEDYAGVVSDRLEKLFKEHNEAAGKPYRLSVSIGILCFNPSMRTTFEELLSKADQLLYEQKQRKREIANS